MYDPGTGRWLTRDPAGYAGGMNLYEYASGDPVNNIDPSGLEPGFWSQAGQFGLGEAKGLASSAFNLAEALTDPMAGSRGGRPDYIQSLLSSNCGSEAEQNGNAVGGALALAAQLVTPGGGQEAAESGFTKVFRGTGHPDIPQLSRSMRGLPANEVLSGAEHFMTSSEAYEHWASGKGYHLDGISVSLDAGTARLAGKHVIAYSVPNSVFNRLPVGDPAQAERIFKYSIPEIYRILR